MFCWWSQTYPGQSLKEDEGEVVTSSIILSALLCSPWVVSGSGNFSLRWKENPDSLSCCGDRVRRPADPTDLTGDCDPLFLGCLAESLRRVGLPIAFSALLLTSLNSVCVDVDGLISGLYCISFNMSKLGDQMRESFYFRKNCSQSWTAEASISLLYLYGWWYFPLFGFPWAMMLWFCILVKHFPFWPLGLT